MVSNFQISSISAQSGGSSGSGLSELVKNRLREKVVNNIKNKKSHFEHTDAGDIVSRRPEEFRRWLDYLFQFY